VILGSAFIFAFFLTLVALASYPLYESRGSFQVMQQASSMSLVSEFFSMGGGSAQIFSEIEIVRSRTIAEVVVDECDLRVKVEDYTYGGHLSRGVMFVLADRLKRGLRALRVDEVSFPPDSVDKPFFVRFTDDSGNFVVTGPGGELGSGHQGTPFVSDALSFTATLMKGPAGTRFKLTPRDAFMTLKSFQETLRVAALGSATRTSLIQVQYRATDPTLASDVVNAVINEYDRRDREWRSSQGEEQTREIETRLAEASTELQEAETELEAYKNEKGVFSLPDEARLAVSDLAQREGSKIDIDLRLSMTRQIYSSLASNIDNDNFSVPPSLTADTVIQQLTSDHARLMMELEDLLLDYTESHPAVIAKREAVRGVRQSILNALHATISSLSEQKGELDSVISGMTDRLYSIPGVEREVIDLTRRRDIADEAFRLLTRRLGESKLVEASFKLGNRIIDHAAPSARPVSPSIKRNLAFGLGLGLVFGVFTGFLLNVFELRIRQREDLETLLNGVPVAEIREGRPEELHRAAGVLALASMHSGTNPISLLLPGPETDKARQYLEEIVSDLSSSLSPILLVDASTKTRKRSFFGADASPGISDIAAGKPVEPQSFLDGKIRVLPGGSEPRAANITSHIVRKRILDMREGTELMLFHTPDLVSEVALRGWATLAGDAVLVIVRDRDSRNSVTDAIEALGDDSVRIHGAILLD
jgi:uncharacterized protein involved in exopolysaccharide biosynthesis